MIHIREVKPIKVYVNSSVVKEYLVKHDFTQKIVANALRTSPAYLAQILGGRMPVSPKMSRKLQQIFIEIPKEELLVYKKGEEDVGV